MMAEGLSHEIVQLLDEPDGDGRQPARVDTLVRARLFADIAEGLDESSLPGTAGTDDLMRLAALLDHGLPPTERDAMLAALTQDPVGRAALISAAELVDAVDGTSHPVPPQLLARAVGRFDGEPRRDRPVAAARPLARPRRLSPRWMLSLAAVLLVVVVTPTAWLVIGNRSDQGGNLIGGGLSGQGSEPTERGISESGTGKQAVPQQKPPTSCDDKGAAQPGDVAKPARGAESASAPTNDPCPTKSPDGHTTAPATPSPGARN